MNQIYLNTNQSEENRIIVTRNNTLIDFEQESVGEENKRGNIYKGVVTNVEPSLEAVFVNFGDAKNGLLPLREIPPNAIGVSEGGPAVGDKLLVQIKKDLIGEKGAGLTGYISLAGNFLVLLPYREDSSGISASASQSARREMGELMDTLPVPEQMSIIARSMAMQHSREDILWDLESYLLPLWKAVLSTAETLDKPVLIYRENDLLLRVMRDYFRPDNGDVIICDDKGRYDELRTFVEMLFPDNIEQIRLHDSADNMVPLKIEEKIEQIYMREVSAVSGVRVAFDSTEALVAVDVNSGGQREGGDIEETALKTNLEAAEIIAEQMRLRNLGGLVVIDFIDMKKRENRETLEKRFSDLTRRDRARMRMSKISEFGLMQISRQRTSRALVTAQTQRCPRCTGSGQVWREHTFALHMLRKIRSSAFSEKMRTLIVQMPRETAVFLLNEKRDEILEIENFSGSNIVIVPDSRFFAPFYKMKSTRGEKENAISIANQMTKQEEAAEQTYKRQPAVKQSQAKLRLQNMLPHERMPSQNIGFFARLKKKLLGDDSKSSDNKPQRPRRQRRDQRQAEAAQGGSNRQRASGSQQQRSRRSRRSGRGRGAGEGEARQSEQRQARQSNGAGQSALSAQNGSGKPQEQRQPTAKPAVEAKPDAKVDAKPDARAEQGRRNTAAEKPAMQGGDKPRAPRETSAAPPPAVNGAPAADAAPAAATPPAQKPAPVTKADVKADAKAEPSRKSAAAAEKPAAQAADKPSTAAAKPADQKPAGVQTVVLPPIKRNGGASPAASAPAPAGTPPSAESTMSSSSSKQTAAEAPKAAKAAAAPKAPDAPAAPATDWMVPGDKQTPINH